MAAADLAVTLPNIPRLIRTSKAIAMLDAILCEEWSSRYYSFNSQWAPDDPTQMMASMRNQTGDHYFIWFSMVGAAIKGFDHESPISPANFGGKPYPGLFEGVPADFVEFLQEPAFVFEDTTFCLWRALRDEQWNAGKIKFPNNSGSDPDGSHRLLSILDGNPSTYVQFARQYFEIDLNESDVAHVYKLKPLTAELLQRMKSERSLQELVADIEEIGYVQGH